MHRVIERAAGAEELLIATDFDGTIAEITRSPEDAFAGAEAMTALSELLLCPGVHVAVISGRSDADLHARTSALGPIWRVAEHGSFIQKPDVVGSMAIAGSATLAERLDLVELDAAKIALHHSAVRIERKATGVAIHFREVPATDRRPVIAALEPWVALARTHRLALYEGREVIEARCAERNKASALAAILETLPRRTEVIYAGDDYTDDCAIAYARERGGLGVYVASSERPHSTVTPDVVVRGPDEWVEVLRRIVAARRPRPDPAPTGGEP